jgi:hypothetical protein
MFSELNQHCTATAPGSEKHCTMIAKTAPYPPCTGTVIWLAYRRVPGLLPDAASGNAYYHNRRAVRFKGVAIRPGLPTRKSKSLADTKHMLFCQNKINMTISEHHKKIRILTG